MASAPQTGFSILQAARGLAALRVVAVHAEQSVRLFVGGQPTALSFALHQGYLGVDFFFVLSGFIIYYTNAPRSARPGWSRRYAIGRLTRIYVPYYPIAIVMAVALALLPDLSVGGRVSSWPATLSLLPWTGPLSLSVAWTLRLELIFYLLAWLMLRSGRVLELSLLWAAAILVAAFFSVKHATPLVGHINLEFLFGIAVASCFMKGRLPPIWLLLAAGAFFIALFVWLGADPKLSTIGGLGFAFLVAATIRAESNGRLSAWSPLLMLGNASYALYLIHLPIVSLCGRALGYAGTPWPVALVLLFVAAIGAALAYHHLFELPALAWTRRRLEGRRQYGSSAGELSESSPPRSNSGWSPCPPDNK